MTFQCAFWAIACVIACVKPVKGAVRTRFQISQAARSRFQSEESHYCEKEIQENFYESLKWKGLSIGPEKERNVRGPEKMGNVVVNEAFLEFWRDIEVKVEIKAAGFYRLCIQQAKDRDYSREGTIPRWIEYKFECGQYKGVEGGITTLKSHHMTTKDHKVVCIGLLEDGKKVRTPIKTADSGQCSIS